MMLSDEELISRAKSAVKLKKTAAGKLLGDVGAALVTDKGNVYVGACFDTREGSGMCAERAAMMSMISAGETKIKKIVAVWTDGTIIPMCGACREWLWQVDKDNWYTDIIVDKNKVLTLMELLPNHWHNPENKMTDEERLDTLRKRAEKRGVFKKAKAIHKAFRKKYKYNR